MFRSSGLRGLGRFAPLTPGKWADSDVQITVSQHFWRGIGLAVRGSFFDEAVDDLKAVFLMSLLPAAKTQLDADFHIVLQELDRVVKLRLEVVGIDVRAELKFLHSPAGGFVGLVGFGFFVKELAVVYDAANGRRGRGRNFDEVELAIARQLQRGIKGHDAELLLLFADDTHFPGTDLAVAPVERFVTLELSECLHSVA